jgi:hypothetical protein
VACNFFNIIILVLVRKILARVNFHLPFNTMDANLSYRELIFLLNLFFGYTYLFCAHFN